jgi:hypothetical protein
MPSTPPIPLVFGVILAIGTILVAAGGGLVSAQSNRHEVARADHATEAEAAATPDRPGPAAYESRFDCDGSIMHQSFKGALESPLHFWFGVRDNGLIDGVVTDVGLPLDLPEKEISGKLSAEYTDDGVFTGGRMVINWPYADASRPVELALMREVFIRSGYHVNGVGKILRRTSKHTYLAGSVWFDPKSYPTLASFYRVSFIAATCYPDEDFPRLSGVD